ncbi:MAG: lipopolysaccharide transport periplasmic protein LptA [Burkholderiales bacterium]
MSLRLICLLAAAALAAAPAARAERADAAKPVNVEADRLTADDSKQVAVFEGKVVLTQGTRMLRADRVTIRQDSEGFQHATAEGKPAVFREKREGSDEWLDGEAERIEYDGKREFVELFNRARLSRNKDEVRGNYISYDQKADFFQVQNAKEFAPAPGRDGRVRAVIQPKAKSDTPARPAPPPPVELKPSPLGSAPQ